MKTQTFSQKTVLFHCSLKKQIKPLLITAMAVLLIFLVKKEVLAGEAVTLSPEIITSNGASVYDMTNESYDTMSTFNNGDTVTIKSDTPIGSLYIAWNNKTVAPWTLSYSDGSTQSCGTHGYLHEYVILDKADTTVTINIESDGMKICRLYVFGEGEKPSWVQDWTPSCEKADILLISTHADDEQLFFGGIIPYYAGELNLSVQVAYFTNYWNGANIREHEKLDGLWTVGVKNYPVNGDFDDLYATSLEAAKTVYDYEATKEFMVRIIRRFKPLVVVGQDFNGEYGHGGHMLTAAAIGEAVELTYDASAYPESAKEYGTWDVPKTYIHLYPERSIKLDCRRQLSNFDNKTVLEVASEGYLQHASQQWCWFYVSDDYEYSCALFGLYRTTVGDDTGQNDILENLTTYEEQARIEAESIAAAESEKASEEESIRASIAESESNYIAASIAEEESKEDSNLQKKVTIYVIIAAILVIILLSIMLVMISAKKKKQSAVRRKRRIKR